jgi:hypothetical protein
MSLCPCEPSKLPRWEEVMRKKTRGVAVRLHCKEKPLPLIAAKKTPDNNDYMSALLVIREFAERGHRQWYGVGVLKSWIKERLNAENGTSYK